MYELCSGAAAKHVLLTIVHWGGSVLGCHGDGRITSNQQRTSERSKEREGGKSGFSDPKTDPGAGPAHQGSRRECLREHTHTQAGRTDSADLPDGLRTVLTAVKMIQSVYAVVGFQRTNISLCVWREVSQKLYLK